LREIPPFRVEDGKVEESGGAMRRGWSALALPGIQPDVVVVATGREKYGVLPVPLRNLESENVPVESQGTFDVCYFQMNVSDASSGACAMRLSRVHDDRLS
jgi:hypothetical protein